MKISELSRRGGVALSTLKFYQREGLIPDGERRHANQVEYGEAHIERVRLIRVLLEIGGLTIAAAREVLSTLDDVDAPLAETFQTAQGCLSRGRADGGSSSKSARQRVLQLAKKHGWCISQDNTGIDIAARALDGLLAIDYDPSTKYLDGYANAAQAAARADLEALWSVRSQVGNSDRTAEVMVVGTVMGDPLFAGLRRLAQQHATHDAFPALDTSEQKE